MSILLLPAVAVVWLSTLAPIIHAESYPVQQHAWYKDYYPQPLDYCFFACTIAVDYNTYNYTPPSSDPHDYYFNQCSNLLRTKSLFYCAQKYCTHAESVAGRNYVNPACEKAGAPLPTIDEYILSEHDLNQVTVLNHDAAVASAKAPLNYPAIPDPEWHKLGVRTMRELWLNWDISFDFSFALIAFWAFVLVVGTLYRGFVSLGKSCQNPRATSFWVRIRRNLILPATVRQHQAEAVANIYTLPPRLESIIIGIYIVMNVVLCFPAYNVFVGNQYYPETKVQLARYISDRTGFLSIAQLPMVWMFAARNDPFLWLTGWSYATYNHFHRWIARISVVHAVVHSIVYSLFEWYASNYKASWAQEYWYCGGIATIVMCLMLGASAYYFRERCYDLFLLVHIGMSLIFFVTLWYHVKIFSGEFNYFLWPCIAMWLLDRLLRIGRTIRISVLPRFKKGVKATATYNCSTKMIRLDVTDILHDTKIEPGVYYYLYLPHGLRAYEGHPFTLCSWSHNSGSPPPSPTHSFSDEEFKTEDPFLSTNNNHTPGEVRHTLLIRPYNGMTGRLRKKLMARSETDVTTTHQTVFLEGPYGTKTDLSTYSDVLVICGGSGITAAISHAHFLVAANTHTKVHVVWAVPQRQLPDDICAHELASVIKTDRCNMVVYLTAEAAEEVRVRDVGTLPRSLYEVRIGRPNIGAVMREYRRMATKNLAIVTCGTRQMSDVCRAAVVQVLGEEGVDTGYYNETLVW